MTRVLFIFLFLANVLSPCDGKVVTGIVQLSSAFTESYVSKFSFSQKRNGYIAGRFYTLGSEKYFGGEAHDLSIALFDDDAWDRFHAAFAQGTLCNDRRALATWTHHIKPATTDDPHNPEHGEDFYFEVEVPTLDHRAHYWYAVMVDCQLEQYDAHPPAIIYEMTFLNGNSHVPADEEGMYEVCFVVMVGMISFIVFISMQIWDQWKSTGQIHLIVVLFSFAYLAQTAAIVCEFLHLRTYMYDGQGLRFRHTWLALDFLADMLQGLSELLISFVLICMAFGWTLSSPMSLITGARSPGGLAAIFSQPADAGAALVFFSIFLLQTVLQYLGRQYEDDFTQFHDYEHNPGYGLLALRVLSCVAFWIGTMGTIRSSRNADVASFLGRLTFIGTAWFLAFPILVISTSFMAPYNRHAVVAGGSIVLQSAALALFLKLFLSHSEYYKISSLSKMGTLFQSGGSLAHARKLATD
eukprot:EG_transcript_11731